MILLLFKRILVICWAIVRRDTSPKIVFYHDVGKKYTTMGTDTDLFWKHMNIAQRKKDRIARICFDDGWRGIWDEREQFKSRGICPLVFIAVRLVGLPGYLTWDEIRTLRADYGFEFQSHGWSHQALVGPYIKGSPVEDRTEAWVRDELVKSKEEIERQLGTRISAFCFPGGFFNEKIVKACYEAGYACVYASYPGDGMSGYVRPRCLAQFASCLEFAAILNGGLNVLNGRYRCRQYFGS